MMRVLGVDPGLVRTGWALVRATDDGYLLEASGLIAPDGQAELGARLAEGYVRFVEVLATCKPDVVVLEDVFSAPQHPRAALLMAHMRGVLCLATGQRGVRLEPMTATTVKQRLTGNGHASKEQVQGMALRLCGLEPRQMRADVSDAIALAVAGLNQFASAPAETLRQLAQPSPRPRRSRRASPAARGGE
ncbi:MAG: crossover junction endodeoxyribonuclease RuvC [Chloroflexi bacterium]|nr:crossover junction endodeoxyribonuclease RuvC [Chloroflexota bacterium]